MGTWTVVLVLIALGIVVGAVLLVIASLRTPHEAADPRVARATSLGMSIGMLFGAALGVIVWISTGEFVFWVVFVGAGMSVGMAVGRASASRPL